MRALYLIGSWWLTAALALAGMLAYFFMALMAEGPAFLHHAWHNAIGMALYAGLVINIIAISVIAIARRLTHPVASMEEVMSMDSFVRIPSGQVDPAEWIRQRGFREVEIEGGLIARKHAASIIPGSVLRLGVVLLLIALPLSSALREEDSTTLTQGEKATLLGTEVRLDKIETSLPPDFLQVGENTIFELELVSAALATPAGTVMAANGHPSSAGGTYYKVIHLGYALELEAPGISGMAELDLLPPGRTHEFMGKGISVRLEPERTIRKGLLTGRQYDLTAPSFRIIAGDDEGVVLEAGETSPDGSTRMGEPGLYVEILAVRDPALALLRAAIGLSLLGLVLMTARPLWYERRIMAVESGGEVYIGYSEEFFKKWGVYRFRDWTAEFSDKELADDD